MISSRASDTARAARRLGRRGERTAARYLARQGLRILARNVHLGRGEIDLVALDGPTLVFVEVKARTPSDREIGLEVLDGRKRIALRATCLRYLRSTPRPIESYRVDAVCLTYSPGRWRPRLESLDWERSVLSLD